MRTLRNPQTTERVIPPVAQAESEGALIQIPWGQILRELPNRQEIRYE